MMLQFILGIFVGTILGVFIMSMLTVGKLTDLQTKIGLLQRDLNTIPGSRIPYEIAEDETW